MLRLTGRSVKLGPARTTSSLIIAREKIAQAAAAKQAAQAGFLPQIGLSGGQQSFIPIQHRKYNCL